MSGAPTFLGHPCAEPALSEGEWAGVRESRGITGFLPAQE
jgi:hypothetical protein